MFGNILRIGTYRGFAVNQLHLNFDVIVFSFKFKTAIIELFTSDFINVHK